MQLWVMHLDLEMIIVPDDVLEKESHLELNVQWSCINISFMLTGSSVGTLGTGQRVIYLFGC